MGSSTSLSDYNDGGYKVVVVGSILIFMQSLMVCGRLVSRYMQKAALAADDFVLFVAASLCIGLCALGIVFPRISAYGPHIGMIEQVSKAEGKLAGQSFVAWMVLYGFAIAASKCAILLLYMRVFTSRMRLFTAVSYVVGFVIVATCFANTIASIFSCSPVTFAWDKSIEHGKCIDEIAFSRFMSVPNVITGAVMLVMPLPLVWQLNVPAAAKVALTATFLHGIIGFIASCARLSILFQHTNPHLNSSTTAITWTIWTLNEPVNYIIAACLPTLRPIFVRILPASFFILSKGSSRGKKTYSSKDVKVSWPSGKLVPSFRIETRNGGRVAMTDSRLSGPWEQTLRLGSTEKVNYFGVRDIGLAKKGGMAVVCEHEEQVFSSSADSSREDLEKRNQIMVERRIEVGTGRVL